MIKLRFTSENHLENKLWLLISINCEHLYLLFILMDNFCASALHNEVLPVPGGPRFAMNHENNHGNQMKQVNQSDLP